MREKLKRVTAVVAAAVLIVVAATAYLRARPDDAGSAADEGRRLVQANNCTSCHSMETQETKVGPGLAGILRRGKLPVSGREATRENVRRQIIEPVWVMPSYAGRLTEEEIEHIVDYLETL